MQELQYNLSGQFGLASRPRAERVRDLYYLRSVQIRENLKENLEALPIQVLPYFIEIFTPNQEVA